MLSDRITRLLTAYVDGELDDRQREALRHWLRRSPEARKLLRALQADAERLRSLSRVSLGPDFAQQVLQTIGSRTGESTRRSALVFPSPIPVWLGLATAAAVVLAVGLGSYFYFAAARRHEQPLYVAEFAENSATAVPHERIQPPLQRTAESRVSVPAGPGELLRAPTLEKPTSETQAKVASPTAVPSRPVEKSSTGPKQPALGSPLQDNTLPSLKESTPRVSRFFNLREFDPDQQKQFQDVLQKNSAHWMELRCTDTLAWMDRLRTAFEAQGIQLSADEDAEAVLKLRMGVSPPFALYLDDVTPSEMIAILQQSSSADRGRAGRLEVLEVNTMGPNERRNLGRLLGINPRRLDGPAPKALSGVDITKPIAKLTQEQVLAFLTGHRAARSEPAKPAGKTFERRALVVTYAPERFRSTPAEVKRFLDTRKERRSGAVQILLVVESAKR
jgi:hypothetical protein